MQQSTAIHDDLSELVVHTLGRTEEATITTMLERIAGLFGAFGCGLWEVSPNADINANPPKGFLNTIGAWWKSKELFALDDVPLDDSPTARSMVEQTVVCINDIGLPDGGAKRGHPFWKKYKIRAMCAVPLVFLDGRLGALNLYRQEDEDNNPRSFTENEQKRLQAIARVVPGLCRAVREKIGLRLVGDVEKMLREAESEKRAGSSGKKARLKMPEVKRVLQQVCERVAKAFDCVETSLFLESGFVNGEPEFRCVATTEPKCVIRKSYLASQDSGRFTGWVIENQEPIWVPDLARLAVYADYLAATYPGLSRNDGNEDTKDARRLLKLKKEDDIPPLSFMAVPVFGAEDWFGGTDLRGVLRCYMARSGPFYFGDREAQLLALVAAQVGQWWARWRADEEMAQENQAWKAMVKALGHLNDFVREQLGHTKPDEGAIFQEALNVAEGVMKGATLNTIRLYDKGEHSLRFAQFSAAAQAEVSRGRVPRRSLALDPVQAKSKSIGVKVYRTGKTAVNHDVTTRRYSSLLFADVRGMVTAPVGVAGENIGVIDFRWTDQPIPSYAPQAAELLGQQLGIYHQLMLLIAAQRASVEDAQRQQREETRAYEDFAHQIKSPLTQAMLRAQTAIEMSDSENEQKRLQVVRGLIRRASRVAMSMRLLAELSHNRPIVPKRATLDKDVLLKKLIELAADTQMHVQSKNINFTVVRETFSNFYLRGVTVDFDLLEQMVSNLLDNAAKYSFKNTNVQVHGGLTRGEQFFIAVTNRGLPFGAGETEICKERGYRSPQAKLTATEGQGIGLWLVDQIARAHGGDLLIESPNKRGETDVRIVFLRH